MIVYVILFVFVISRMWVGIGEYQDIEYSPISTITTVLIILISAFGFVIGFSKVLSSGICRLVILFLVICLISTFLYGNPDIQLEKQIVFIAYWEASFLLFYLLSYNDTDTVGESKNFFLILAVPVSIIILMSNVLRGSMAYDVSRMGNNMIFYLLTLLPWFMLSGNRLLRLVCVLFVLMMSVITLKRSAMAVSVICASIFIYTEFVKGNDSKLKSAMLCIIMLVAVVGLFFYSNSASEGAAVERVEDLEEDEGSGRIERYKDVLRLIRDEENRGKLIFGHGYRTVETSLGESSSAHNDFLEVLYDFGLLGLIAYSLIHISLIKRILFLKRNNISYTGGYLMSYVVFLIMSMVSHLIIYPTYFVFLASYWGTIEGELMFANKEYKRYE